MGDAQPMRGLAGLLKAHWQPVCFVLCLCLLTFAYGVAAGVYKLFPYDILEMLAAAGVDWAEYPAHNAGLRPGKFLAPAGDPDAGVIAYVSEKAYPGATFLGGFFGDSLGMKLVDMKGAVVHEWRVSFNEIWPDSPNVLRERSDWGTQIHGAILYPSGDVIFNFQYGGLVRIDACSEVQWKLPRVTHHSVYEASDGNLWVPGRVLHEEPDESFPMVPPPFWEDYVLEVSPDGHILRQISVLDAIFRSGYEGVLFANGSHAPTLDVPLDHDFTHLNDVETLDPSMAAAFPLFAPGDVLISLRNLDLLLVLDGKTEKVKWSRTGPYLRQHDPDFLANGRISVFDNRRDGAGGAVFGGSRILQVDPVTGEVVTVYGGNEHEMFYTNTMGDHQHLPNGNILITESEAGHAFEVTPEGEEVWSFVNRWDEDEVALIGRATRYPERYAAFAESAMCP